MRVDCAAEMDESALTPDGVTPAFFLRAMVKLSSDESPGAIG